jgi:hypothetical protein
VSFLFVVFLVGNSTLDHTVQKLLYFTTSLRDSVPQTLRPNRFFWLHFGPSVKIVFLVHCRFFLRRLVWLPGHNGKPRGDFLKGLRIRLIVLDEFKARRFVRF